MSIKLSVKDIIWGYFAQFFSIASGMIMLPLVVRMLKPEEIGMNYLMITVGSMVSLFDFGFAPQFGRSITYIFSGAQTLRKEGVDVTQLEKKEINYRLLSTMIHTAKSVYGLLSFIVLLVMLTFGTLYIFKVTNGFTNVHNSFFIWVIYSISTFINMYFTYYSSLLTGKGMIMEAKKAMVYSKILYIILSVTLLLSGVGLIAIAIANLIAPFLDRYISYNYFFTKEMKHRLEVFEITKKEKVELFKIIWYNSKKLGLVYIGSYAIMKLGIFIAGLYLSLNEVASYGLMVQFVGIIYVISGTLFALFNPHLSAIMVEGNKLLLLRTFSFSMGIVYLSYIILGVAFLILGPFLLTFLKSNIILPSCGIVALYLMVMLLEQNHSFFATVIVIGNKVPFLWVSLVTGGLVALGSFFSLAFTNLGIIGLVLIQGIVQLAYSNWKWPQVVCQYFGISFISFLRLAFLEVYNKQKEYFYDRSK